MLADLLDDPLVVVDVGCRWGAAPAWTEMGDRCLLIGFDPDSEECARLASLAGPLATARFVPVALGAEPGLATLYLTKNPGGHSVYPSSAEAVQHHPGLEGGRVEQTMAITVTTLDDWCRQEGVPHVDVIKLDTQGSELDILQGAIRMLDGVRAVEVEVQFNELYEGVPLFGDVDRFLRSQGFMLWRLKNLAHYAQYGAPTGWTANDVQYFDELQSHFQSGSGQLYWADAFFVKVDMARPTEAAGWRQLLRDASVAGAMGFPDLVALAVDRARATAPPAVLSRLDQFLAAETDGNARRHGSDERAPLLRGTYTFDLGQRNIEGWGWGEPQLHPNGGLRWTGPGRDASVDVPLVVVPGTRVEVMVAAAMSAAILENLVVELDRVAVPLTSWPHEHGLLYVGVVPEGHRSARRFTQMVVRTIETVPWNEINPDSTDESELGAALRWVRFTAPG